MKNVWMVLGCCALLLACKREDTAAPSWQVVLNGTAAGSDLELTGGDVLTFTGDAQDDVQLGQAAFASTEWIEGFAWRVGDWSWDDLVELEGTHALVGKQWAIPDSVDGAFQLRVVLSDALGQTAPEVQYTLHIANPSLRRIQLDSIAGHAVSDLTESDVFLAGSSLDLIGTVNAPAGLTEVVVTLESEGVALESWTWESPQGTSCDLSAVPFTFPVNLPGVETELRLRVYSVDADGTVANAFINLKISA